MATSVSRIQAQIAKLQQQADTLKQAAVKRVQREIELHGLTSEDLFGGAAQAGSGRKARSASAKPATAKTSRSPKYGDRAGNTWGGMGKRPQWLKDALGSGASMEDFLLDKQLTASSSPAVKSAGRKRKAAAKPAAKKTRAQSGAKKAAATRKGRASAAGVGAEGSE